MWFQAEFVKFLSLPTKKSLSKSGKFCPGISAAVHQHLLFQNPHMAWRGSWAGVKLHALQWFRLQNSSQFTARQAQPWPSPHPLTSGQYSCRELATVPPKIICKHLKLKFTRSPIIFFSLKFQIHHISRTPFIQLLSNFCGWKKNSGKEDQPILHPPIKVLMFSFVFV